jgi:hypothetical protein
MPGVVLDPRVDAYGADARAGAIADYLEAQALHGRNLRRSDVADIAEEQGWSRKSRRTVIVEGDDLDEDPASWAEIATAQINERADILGEAYPFDIRAGALTYRGSTRRDDSYVSLLAIAMVHAWRLPSPVRPTVVLEDVVRRALEGISMLAVDMGTGDRRGLSFVDNLLSGGQYCGLSPTDNPVPRKASAKDAGVDTLGTLPLSDGRSGRWVFLGQVTCGSSLTWKRKLKEPEPQRWRQYLQEALPPQAFLAVPHHIDSRFWEELMVSQDGLLLDRLRLQPVKGGNSSDEQLLIDALLAVPPE